MRAITHIQAFLTGHLNFLAKISLPTAKLIFLTNIF